MSQSLSMERPEPSIHAEKFGALSIAAVLAVGALTLALVVIFALVLAGALPAPGEIAPLFTT